MRVVGGLLEAGVHTVKSDLGLEGEGVREEVRLRETGRERGWNQHGLFGGCAQTSLKQRAQVGKH